MKTWTSLSLFFAIAIFASGCGKNPASEPLTQSEARHHHFNHHHGHAHWWGWGGWGKAVTAWGDHLRFVGVARYLTARANYENALAARQWVRARAEYRILRHIEIELRRIQRQRYAAEKARQRIDDAAKRMNAILTGKVSKASGLGFFMTLPGFGSLPTIKAGAMVGPFGKEQFLSSLQTRPEVEEFPGGTALEFLVWVRKHYYDVVVDSDAAKPTAWQLLIQIRQEILDQITATDSTAAEEAEKTKAALKE